LQPETLEVLLDVVFVHAARVDGDRPAQHGVGESDGVDALIASGREM